MARPDIESMTKHREQAVEEVHELNYGHKDWRICIPVQDDDSDQVIMAALIDLENLLNWVATLEDKILVAAEDNNTESALSLIKATARRIKRGQAARQEGT